MLFRRKGDLTVKVVDFGISGSSKPQDKESTSAGSLGYMPPEVLDGSNLSSEPPIDIWALGCILYSMLLGRLPFFGHTPEDFEDQIINKQPKFKQKVRVDGHTIYPPPLTAPVKEIIKAMLEKDPKERISIFTILNHPWLAMSEEELDVAVKEAKEENGEEEG